MELVVPRYVISMFFVNHNSFIWQIFPFFEFSRYILLLYQKTSIACVYIFVPNGFEDVTEKVPSGTFVVIASGDALPRSMQHWTYIHWSVCFITNTVIWNVIWGDFPINSDSPTLINLFIFIGAMFYGTPNSHSTHYYRRAWWQLT